MRWTEGPWEWKNDDQPHIKYRLAPGVLITDYESGTPWGDEIDRANARLISQAPVMAEALEKLRRLTHDWKMAICRSLTR